MRRALVASILACVTGGVVVEVALDTHAALETFSLMLGVSMLALGVALTARHERRQIGALGHQLALAVGIAVGAILAAVGVAAGLMFISSEDALLVSVMAGVVAVVGLQVAALLTTPIVEDITRLRDRLRAVGVGDRRADLTTNGSDELAELVAEANAMIARLAEEERGRTSAEDARQRLIIAVSHDLRTPLTSLRLMTEAIDDEIATGPTRARYLRDMQTHVAALSALVDDLFDLSRLQAGEATLTIEPADIGALADETVGALRATAATRDVTLSCCADRIGHQPLVAEIDRERIRRVLMNLIDNAIRHSPPGGEVSTHVSHGSTRQSRCRSPTRAAGSQRQSARMSSRRSSAAAQTRRVRATERAWAWRSPARSSTHMAEASGSPKPTAGPASASRFLRRRWLAQRPHTPGAVVHPRI